MELKDRERKVDINSMTLEQADALSAQIGKEIAKIMDEANLKCNALLNIYGMQTQIGYKVVKLGTKPRKSRKSKETQES